MQTQTTTKHEFDFAKVNPPKGAKCEYCRSTEELEAFKSVCYGSSERMFWGDYGRMEEVFYKPHYSKEFARNVRIADKIDYCTVFPVEEKGISGDYLGNSDKDYRGDYKQKVTSVHVHHSPRIWVFCKPCLESGKASRIKRLDERDIESINSAKDIDLESVDNETTERIYNELGIEVITETFEHDNNDMIGINYELDDIEDDLEKADRIYEGLRQEKMTLG